jgi:hypothetical protein
MIYILIIRDLQGLILGPDTDYPEIYGVSSIPPAKRWSNSVKETVSLSFYMSPTSLFTIIHSFVTMRLRRRRKKLRKKQHKEFLYIYSQEIRRPVRYTAIMSPCMSLRGEKEL